MQKERTQLQMYEKLRSEYGDIMTPNDVAKFLGCHASHVRALCQSGKMPAVKIGERWYITTSSFANMLETGRAND